MSNPHRYCVIMCGGIGSRFWPYSRADRPKQFIDFFGTGRSLLQMSYDRILPLVDKEHVIIVTNDHYAPLVREQLPELADHQILLEPARRNTAPCIAWAAHHIHALDPEASMIVTPATTSSPASLSSSTRSTADSHSSKTTTPCSLSASSPHAPRPATATYR